MSLQQIIEQVEKEFDELWLKKPSDEDMNGGKDIKRFLRTKIREAVEATIEATSVEKRDYDNAKKKHLPKSRMMALSGYNSAVSLQQQKARTFLGGDKE